MALYKTKENNIRDGPLFHFGGIPFTVYRKISYFVTKVGKWGHPCPMNTFLVI